MGLSSEMEFSKQIFLSRARKKFEIKLEYLVMKKEVFGSMLVEKFQKFIWRKVFSAYGNRDPCGTEVEWQLSVVIHLKIYEKEASRILTQCGSGGSFYVVGGERINCMILNSKWAETVRRKGGDIWNRITKFACWIDIGVIIYYLSYQK